MSEKMTVTITVGVEPVARIAKGTGRPYRGVQFTGYHRPGYLPLTAAKTLLQLAKGKTFVADLQAAIAQAEAQEPKAGSE